MTKEELVEFYKTMPEDDKRHFDIMFDIRNIDRGIKSLNPQLQMFRSLGRYELNPKYLMHFKREMEEISDDNYFKYIYKLLYVSTHSETKDLLVNYEAIYDDEANGIGLYHICSRPIEMFISRVDTEKYPNVKQKYRFELVQLAKDDGMIGHPKICCLE